MKFKTIKVDRSIGTSVDDGILYLVVFELEEKTLVKIGITTRSIEERVIEILLGMFKVYRYFPYSRPKRYKKTSNIRDKESTLHKHFAGRRYTPSKKFGGYTELFDIPLEEAVVAYEALLDGKPIPQ